VREVTIFWCNYWNSYKGVKLTKKKSFSPANIVDKCQPKYRVWSVEEAWFILTNFPDLKLAQKPLKNGLALRKSFAIIKQAVII